MLGYTDHEIEPHFSAFERLLHPDDKARVFEMVDAVLQGDRDFEIEFRIRHRGGHYMDILSRGFPVRREADGKIIRIVGTHLDLTERKQTEAAIRSLNIDLERRAVLLESANRELEAFAYSVSHDLRAPLRGIDGFSQALLEDYADRLDEQGKDYLSRVREASRRMDQLIDDMLKLSRVTRSEIQYEEIDLSSMVRESAAALWKAQPARRVDFRITKGLVIRGDPRLFRLVIDNLLGNAWKFTCRKEEAVIEFGTVKMEGRAAYFVRDNGAGFDQAYAEKLFVPFQRLHAESEFAGTGIGLSIIKRIIHRHGGEAWAEGEAGKGATFYFTLGSV
jgi:PAS domain S-box-containing protein